MKHARNLVLLFVLASSSSALADAKSDAKAHIKKATAFHANGKFKEALEQLTLAYTLDPKPELLYAIGQVHVQLGECDKAISFYERFLTSKPKPSPGPASAAKEAIETCKTQPPTVKTEPDPQPPPQPEPEPQPQPQVNPEPPRVAEPPPIQQPPPPQPERPPAGGKPWYKDMIGDALVGGGVVAGIVSVVFFQKMSSKLDDADAEQMDYERHQSLNDEAASAQRLGWGFAIGGAVLIGAGVARYMLRDTGESHNKVAVTPTNDGGYITWMGRF